MKNYVQEGDRLTILSAGAVASGATVLFGDIVGIAQNATTGAGQDLVIQTTGVVTMRKASGTINPGVRVFWDNSAGRVTTTPTSNRCIGYHAEQVANSGADNTDILVLLRPNTPAGT